MDKNKIREALGDFDKIFNGKYKINTNTGCWEYTKCTNEKGYGVIRYNGKNAKAHRVSYLIFNGSYDKKLCILHKCDNPKCINPEHLSIGTQLENIEDMDMKGRRHSILTRKDVEEIRASTEISSAIASKYGVAARTIRRARDKKHWQPLPSSPKE